MTDLDNLKNELVRFIRDEKLNVYDVAVMTPEDGFSVCLQPCNACNENYSMTKFFIMTMTGILCDRGLLSTEDRITEILAREINWQHDPAWDRVTVEHCLTHSAGITRGALDIDRDEMRDYPTDDFLKLIMSEVPEKEPGTFRHYTDCVHYLLSRVIEEITKKPADRTITEEILNPLHFSQASFAHCPHFHVIGSSGSYMKAADTVKMAKLYLDNGIFDGRRIISEDWVRRAEDKDYDLAPVGKTDFFGKGGMNGQILMYSRKKQLAVSWHSFIPEGDRIARLENFFGDLPNFS